MADLVSRLPKAELHLHLEGSIRPELALALARKNGVALPGAEAGIEGLRAEYRFPDFAAFIRVYLAVSSCLVDAEDFAEATVDLARALAQQNVRYAEVTFTAMTHAERGVHSDVMIEGLTVGRARARDEHGVELRWVFDIVRTLLHHAEPTLAFALEARERDPGGPVGIGLGGPEDQDAPVEPLVPTFERARAEGLVSVPHAGELRGPESIWQAVRLLGAQRIGHGIRCLEDPALVDWLGEHGIVLEVCPSSNVALGVVPELAAHPLPRLLEAGLAVTLASDDPPLFGTTLVEEYRKCAEAFGWDDAEVRQMAAASVEHSLMDGGMRQELLAAQRRVGRSELT